MCENIANLIRICTHLKTTFVFVFSRPQDRLFREKHDIHSLTTQTIFSIQGLQESRNVLLWKYTSSRGSIRSLDFLWICCS